MLPLSLLTLTFKSGLNSAQSGQTAIILSNNNVGLNIKLFLIFQNNVMNIIKPLFE